MNHNTGTGIDTELYEKLEAMDIFYESQRAGVSRMKGTFLKILSEHKDGITWYQLQAEYDHIFNTLGDYQYLLTALNQLVESGYILADVGYFIGFVGFAGRDDEDTRYRYNPDRCRHTDKIS